MMNKRFATRTTGILTLCLTAAVSVTTAAAERPVVKPARLDQAPVINGLVDDAAWENAARIELKHMLETRHDKYEPDEKPEVRTIAWLGYDDDWLYIGVRCEENGKQPLADQRGPDNLATASDDCLELFLMPEPDLYYHFFQGAGGSTREQRLVSGRRDLKWKAGYMSAAQVTDYGWSAEWAIPLYILGRDVFPETIGFNLGRNRHVEGLRRSRLFTWAPLGQRGFHDPERFGKLKGLGGLSVPAVTAPRIEHAHVCGPYERVSDGFLYRLDLSVENMGNKAGSSGIVVYEQLDDGSVIERELGDIEIPATGSVSSRFDIITESAAARRIRAALTDAILEDKGRPVSGDTVLGPDIGYWSGDDMPFGADAAKLGNPIGGGAGYNRIVEPDAVTVEVDSAAALVELLNEWNELPPGETAGRIIGIRSGVDLEFSDVLKPADTRPYQAFITVPAGVTLAGDRGRNDSPGPMLRYSYAEDDISTALATRGFISLRPGARLTGLRLRGPDAGHLDPPPSHAGSRMRGVHTGSDTEVDNCVVSHFSWACVNVSVSNVVVRHNELSDSAYPVLVGGSTGYAVITGNRIRWGWHATAGGGAQGTGYEVSHNEFIHVGPGGGAHAVDMHCWRRMMRGHGPDYPYLSIGGDRMLISYNTFTDDLDAIRLHREQRNREGEPRPSVDVAIRGMPRDLVRIHGNRFADPDPGSSLRLYSESGGHPGMHDRANVWVHDNVYGSKAIHVPLARETRPRINFIKPDLEITQVQHRVWSTRHVNMLGPDEKLPVELHIEVMEPLSIRSVSIVAGNREVEERQLFSSDRPPAAGEVVIDAADWDEGCYYFTVFVEDNRGITGQHSTSFTVTGRSEEDGGM